VVQEWRQVKEVSVVYVFVVQDHVKELVQVKSGILLNDAQVHRGMMIGVVHLVVQEEHKNVFKEIKIY
jgi:hypothetical protein